MKQSISVNWLDKMAFEAEVNGHKIVLDADSSVGGENRGPRPKPLLMVSLAGCTAMDVVSILTKMRVEFSDIKVDVDGDLTEEHPKRFEKLHITYKVTGKNVPFEKVKKAVDMSEERYCGVSATLKGNVEITSEIVIIEE